MATLGGKIGRLAKPLPVAVACGTGIGSDFAVDFLSLIGCDVIPLYCLSDGRFPNQHPDPVKRSNLTELIEACNCGAPTSASPSTATPKD